jgi:hypothetical protein
MRRVVSPLLVFLFAAASAIATDDPADPLAGCPEPLAAAIRAFGRDAGRWAYTQHIVQYDRKGRVEQEQLARHDPSRHYDVQWTLLKQNGKDATESQAKKFRKDRAKMSKNRRTLGELLVLKDAKLVRESGDELVYEVPLKKDDDNRLPPEKFEVLVKVHRAPQTLRAIDVQLKKSWRFVGVVNVKSGEAHLTFDTVLPEHGPAVTSISGEGRATILMVPVGAKAEVKRSDFKRVTPYDERFNVKIGPLKAIDF